MELCEVRLLQELSPRVLDWGCILIGRCVLIAYCLHTQGVSVGAV